MNVLFGKLNHGPKSLVSDFLGELVGVFSALYNPASGVSPDMFMQIINKYV
jgi:hypothetical protein